MSGIMVPRVQGIKGRKKTGPLKEVRVELSRLVELPGSFAFQHHTDGVEEDFAVLGET